MWRYRKDALLNEQRASCNDDRKKNAEIAAPQSCHPGFW
jgi:hypothetical protein